MPQETSDGNRREDDRGPKQVRVYITRNGGRYVKANELMKSEAAKDALDAMKEMEERDRALKRNEVPSGEAEIR